MVTGSAHPLRVGMRQSRPTSFENSQPAAANALIALVRLLACQAAREFVAPRRRHLTSETTSTEGSHMTDRPDCLRAGDIARPQVCRSGSPDAGSPSEYSSQERSVTHDWCARASLSAHDF